MKVMLGPLIKIIWVISGQLLHSLEKKERNHPVYHLISVSAYPTHQ